MGGQRGRLISAQDKADAILLIQEACVAGCRKNLACELLELDMRTFQRWQKHGDLADKRRGPITVPANKLTDDERAHILAVVNSAEYRDQPPTQIIPNLADKNIYIGSESTMYRVLNTENMLQHRSAARPRKHHKPNELHATKSNQVWSWDITYLVSDIRGKYFYLYLFLDIFSRKIVGFDVYDEQTAENAARVVLNAHITEGVNNGDVTLHSDNGKPMKGGTMLMMLHSLGIAPSVSRPSVSDDNPFSEALFRTLKYCPKYPNKPFSSVEDALAWVEKFVYWYNNIHLHSGIKFVTPNSRHQGLDKITLENRSKVYELARQQNPNRWSTKIRNWDRIEKVYLNSKPNKKNAA